MAMLASHYYRSLMMTQLRKDEEVYDAIEVLAGDIALISTATTAMNEMNRDMYGNVANYIHHHINDITGLDLREGLAKQALDELEKRIKDKHGVTSLPNSYRSSKSVLLKAIALGIYIYDENDKLQPKSVLEKRVKKYMAAAEGMPAASQLGLRNIGDAVSTTKTDYEKVRDHLLEAHKICVNKNWPTIAGEIEVVLKKLM